MLKKLINEYKERYLGRFEEGARGRFERFVARVSEPRLFMSVELKARLNWLDSQFDEPPAVAVVGQFSSGKSTLLNAILKSDWLPTGAVPVTAVATTIKWGPVPLLKIIHKNGDEQLLNVSQIAGFVDQRRDLSSVAGLVIYAPNEILKNISFIDTPGLNSRSDSDTNATKNALKKAAAVLWVSLIDNAARQSELDELGELPPNMRAICLLNQADKLTDDEIGRVLEHAKGAFNGRFEQILAVSAAAQAGVMGAESAQVGEAGQNAASDAAKIAISDSAKNDIYGAAKNGKNAGDFDKIFDFIASVAGDKERFIFDECEKIRAVLVEQFRAHAAIMEELEGIFAAFEGRFSGAVEEAKREIGADFELYFEKIKQNAGLISREINASLKKDTHAYFRPKNGLLKGWERVEYERFSLNSDEALSKLVYNDDRLAKTFRAWRRGWGEVEQKLNDKLDYLVAQVCDEILRFCSKYERMRRTHEWHSKGLSARLGQFAAEGPARLVAGFLKEVELAKAAAGLFFEKIAIKVAQNYQNAVKLSVGFLNDKIERAARDYESDPAAFGLYFPLEGEINERVLKDLSYYEFEDDFTGTNAWAGRFLSVFEEKILAVCAADLATINGVKSTIKADLELVSAGV